MKRRYTKEDYIQAARDGLTKTQAAHRLGVSVQSVSVTARTHGITFAAHEWPIKRQPEPRRPKADKPPPSPLAGLTRQQKADVRTLVQLGGQSLDEAIATATRKPVRVRAPTIRDLQRIGRTYA